MFARRPRALGAGFLPLAALLIVASLALGLTGCKHGYQEPAIGTGQSAASQLLGATPGMEITPPGDMVRRPRLLYPLAVGNRWDYVIHSRIVLITLDGPQPPDEFDSPWVAQINSTVQVGTREYFLQEEFDPKVASVSLAFRMRQDGSGLYELDPPAGTAAAGRVPANRGGGSSLAMKLSAYVDRTISDAPRRAAFQRAALKITERAELLRRGAVGAAVGGGPDPGEISLLRYPLAVGANWVIRESPLFESTVVARDHLSLPAGSFEAWRIRNTSELFGPTDLALLWYGSAGLVRIQVHAEGEATDETGNVIGQVIFDSDQVLTELQLAPRGIPHALATVPLPSAGND